MVGLLNKMGGKNGLGLIMLFLGGGVTLVSTIFFAFYEYSGVIFWDQWEVYISGAKMVFEGGFSFWDFVFMQQNEHKSLVIRLIFLIDLLFFKDNLWIHLVIGFVVHMGLVGSLCYSVGQQINVSKKIKYWFFALFVMVGFCWLQKENFTFFLQYGFMLVLLVGFWSYYFIYVYALTKKIRYYWLSCGGVFLTCFSFGNGLIGGFVFLLSLFFIDIGKVKKMGLFLWGGFCFWLYLKDLNPAHGVGSPLKNVQDNPFDVLMYFLSVLGSPLYFFIKKEVLVIKILGGGVLVGYLWLTVLFLKKRLNDSFDFVLYCFLSFLLGSVFMIAMGRAHFGMAGAWWASRYQTLTLLSWATTLFLLFKHSKKAWGLWVIKGCVIGLCVVFSLVPIGVVMSGVMAKNYDKKIIQKLEFIGFRMGFKSRDFLTKVVFRYVDTSECLLLFKHDIANMNMLNKAIEFEDKAIAKIKIDSVILIRAENCFYKVKGVVFFNKDMRGVDFIGFKNGVTQERVGYGVLRQDNVFKATTRQVNFEGYVKDTFWIRDLKQ